MIDTILNIDYAEGIKSVADKSISLVLTDPPYEVSRDSNFASGESKGRDTDRFRISIDFGEWDSKGSFNIANMCKESYRVLKDGGYFICFYDIWKISDLKRYCEDVGFTQLRFIEWVKTNPVPLNSKVNYLTNAREIAVCAVKGSKPVFNSEYDNGIYEFPICHDEHRFHPTQKPLDLVRSLILKHSNEGDTVLDNTIGSGTTAIACIRDKRHFIGFELNKEYYDKACKRINEEQQQLSLF